MPDAPAPAPAPEQELGQESGLRDLLTTLAGNVQSIQDRGIAAEAKLEQDQPGGQRHQHQRGGDGQALGVRRG